MEHLKKAGLFAGGLLQVAERQLVDRYNRSLEALGISPTTRKRFSIDRRGWSPQVADEKKDPEYLSHGEANQFAIIISPNQRLCPVIMPLNSYDEPLLDKVFEAASAQINTITTREGIWLDLDQEIDAYKSPDDLVLLEKIKVRSGITGNLTSAIKEQQSLVKSFRKGDNWMDGNLRRKMLDNIRQYGDLRSDMLVFPDIIFKPASFHTRAVGGVFVIRHRTASPLLIVEDEKRHRKHINHINNCYGLRHISLFDELVSRRLLEVDTGFYLKNPELVQRLEECLLVEAVYADGKNRSLNLTGGTIAARKGIINRFRDDLPHEFFELEKLMITLGNGRRTDISRNCFRLLARPSKDVSQATRRTLWAFLARLNPVRLELLYQYNKPEFYKCYQSWPMPRKLWAIKYLTELGLASAEKRKD